MNEQFKGQDDFEKKVDSAIVRKKNEDLKQKWAEKLNKEYGVERTEKNASSNMWMRILIGLLVTLILAGATYYFNHSGQQDPVYMASNMLSEFEMVKDPSMSVRASEEVALGMEEKAYMLIMKGENEAAVDLYEMMGDEKTNKAKYYQAVAAYKSGKTDEAKLLLRENIKGNKLYKDESNWLLALILTSEADLDEAKKILESIVSGKKYRHAEASTILDNLDK